MNGSINGWQPYTWMQPANTNTAPAGQLFGPIAFSASGPLFLNATGQLVNAQGNPVDPQGNVLPNNGTTPTSTPSAAVGLEVKTSAYDIAFGNEKDTIYVAKGSDGIVKDGDMLVAAPANDPGNTGNPRDINGDGRTDTYVMINDKDGIAHGYFDIGNGRDQNLQEKFGEGQYIYTKGIDNTGDGIIDTRPGYVRIQSDGQKSFVYEKSVDDLNTNNANNQFNDLEKTVAHRLDMHAFSSFWGPNIDFDNFAWAGHHVDVKHGDITVNAKISSYTDSNGNGKQDKDEAVQVVIEQKLT